MLHAGSLNKSENWPSFQILQLDNSILRTRNSPNFAILFSSVIQKSRDHPHARTSPLRASALWNG